jgi:hypothetical protein
MSTVCGLSPTSLIISKSRYVLITPKPDLSSTMTRVQHTDRVHAQEIVYVSPHA